MRFTDAQTDLDLAREGVWVTWENGVELKIASDESPRYLAELRRLSTERMTDLKRTTLPDSDREEIYMQARCRYVLLDWRGFEDEQDQPLPYSYELAFEAFKSGKSAPLYRFVINASATDKLFRTKRREDIAGNSGPSSSGSSTGATTPNS